MFKSIIKLSLALSSCAVLMASAANTTAQAQVFLRDSNSSSSTSGSTTNDSTTSRSSSIILRQEGASTSNSDRFDYLKERTRDRSINTETGVAYSIEDYNRRLMEQRSRAASGQQSSSDIYKKSYSTSTSDRVKTNPFTGRYSTASEISKMEEARIRYYQTHEDAVPKERTRAEERFFNKNGYYKEDASLLVDEKTGALSTRSYGSNVNLENRASTSQKYEDSANRFKNYGSDR